MLAKKMLYCSFFHTNKNIWHEGKKKQLAPHYNVRTSSIHEKSLALPHGKKKNCMKVRRERDKKKTLAKQSHLVYTCKKISREIALPLPAKT